MYKAFYCVVEAAFSYNNVLKVDTVPQAWQGEGDYCIDFFSMTGFAHSKKNPPKK